MLVGCGGGSGGTGDAGPSPDTAQADASPGDGPSSPPSYVAVEAMVELRADIAERTSALVHVMNTGGTPLSFSLAVTGEVKAREGEQPLQSQGCNFAVAPGQDCIASVSFFPLKAGDISATLTIHPSDASLSEYQHSGSRSDLHERACSRVPGARHSHGQLFGRRVLSVRLRWTLRGLGDPYRHAVAGERVRQLDRC